MILDVVYDIGRSQCECLECIVHSTIPANVNKHWKVANTTVQQFIMAIYRVILLVNKYNFDVLTCLIYWNSFTA